MSLPWGVTSQRDSYFGQASAAIAPAFAPAGFGTWEASGALVTGFVAKEVVVTTMAQTFVPGADEAGQAGEAPTDPAAEPVPTVAEDLVEIGSGLLAATDAAVRSTLSIIPGVDVLPEAAAEPQETALSSALSASFTPLAGLAFVVFVLIYTPCVATLAAIRSEFGWRWAAFSGAYQLGLAWLLAVVVFQVGTFLGAGLMLARILAAIRAAGRPLCQADLQRELGIDAVGPGGHARHARGARPAARHPTSRIRGLRWLPHPQRLLHHGATASRATYALAPGTLARAPWSRRPPDRWPAARDAAARRWTRPSRSADGWHASVHAGEA